MAEDLQIGIVGGQEPFYCGCGCGQEVRGRHSVAHDLGGGRYTTYLAKHDHLWNEAHPQEAVPAPPQRTVSQGRVVSASDKKLPSPPVPHEPTKDAK